MASPGTFAASQGGATTTATTTPAQSSASSSFPTSSVITASELLGYGVSSSEIARFMVNGQLDQTAAQDYIAYVNMTQTERQKTQEALVQAGLLGSKDATGELDNSTARGSYISAIGAASQNHESFDSYVQRVGDYGLGTLQNQINQEASVAQADLNKSKSVTATVENPTTLAATITNAFDQALGYAPSQDQINSFISQMQGQDVANAQATSGRPQAQAELNQVTQEQNALQALGPGGLDAFLEAYKGAVHGLPGGATQQGPQVGTRGQYEATLPGTKTLTDAQMAAREKHDLEPAMTAINSKGQAVITVNRAASAQAASQPIFGGEYALSPQLWDQGLKLMGKTGDAYKKEYPTVGQAPTKIQDAVVAVLAKDLFQQSGSWAQVASHLAAGSPAAKGNVGAFAQQMAVDVNDRIKAIQTEANQTPVVNEKVTAPDAAAEASAAAKQADPAGYYAANFASLGSILNQMIAGAPQMYGQSTSDTFTGPVAGAGASIPATGA